MQGYLQQLMTRG